MSVEPQRLQKLLAAQGLGSRREIESWIEAGRIRVNGEPATLGMRATLSDRIALDGKPLELTTAVATMAVLIYHKPVGEVTTRSDPQGRPTVFDRLPQPKSGRWIVVGRLDTNTSGLLLFTTDGALAHRLMHPSSEIEREYLVRVRSVLPPAALQALRQGVTLDDGPARFDRIDEGRHSDGHGWYRVVLREGRNREVRRLFEAVGHEVSRLSRLRYASVSIPDDLKPGCARIADRQTVEALQQLVAP